jgi:hypothetical protein
MSEWLKEHAWKACVGETLPWVRIPLSPPISLRSVGGLTSGSVGLRRRSAHGPNPTLSAKISRYTSTAYDPPYVQPFPIVLSRPVVDVWRRDAANGGPTPDAARDSPTYTLQISIAFFRLSIGSRPSAGEYSWVTNPVKPRSAIACITKR